MAKTSAIHRNLKREKLVRKFAARRAELKRRARDFSLTPEERQTARERLASLPRNSSPVRLRTRCVVSRHAPQPGRSAQRSAWRSAST